MKNQSPASVFRKTLIAHCCALLIGTAATSVHAQATVSSAELLRQIEELRQRQVQLEQALKRPAP